jgi:pimeloyl-ACP methyl ester carboxylesterase
MNSRGPEGSYQDIWYQSQDNLRLYARDYQPTNNDGTKTTLLCMHGLTRNSADFAALAEHFQKRYRVIAVDQRGRGQSDSDPEPSNYHPGTYVQDMFSLIELLKLEDCILFGTSMGGLMSLIMASLHPGLFQAIILNDVGPEIDQVGLNRIQSYVGKQSTINTWDEAVAQAKMINQHALPDLDAEAWLRFARAIYREDNHGGLELAYDPSIAEPMQTAGEESISANLWPQFNAVASTPLLVIRGESSDILSMSCVNKMRSIHLSMEFCQVPNRGHTPLLDEACSLQAINDFLDGLSREESSAGL